MVAASLSSYGVVAGIQTSPGKHNVSIWQGVTYVAMFDDALPCSQASHDCVLVIVFFAANLLWRVAGAGINERGVVEAVENRRGINVLMPFAEKAKY